LQSEWEWTKLKKHASQAVYREGVVTTSQPEEFSGMRVIRLSREGTLKAAGLMALVGVVIPIPILWITLGDEVVGPRSASIYFAAFRAAYMLGVLVCAAANLYLWIAYRRGDVDRWLARTRPLRAKTGVIVLPVAALWVGVKGVNYLSAILARDTLRGLREGTIIAALAMSVFILALSPTDSTPGRFFRRVLQSTDAIFGGLDKLLIVFCILYCYGAVAQSNRVNTDMAATDQSAYMDYAKELRQTNYTYIGGRNRMPVYPFLQSLFYSPQLTDQEFFVQGKYRNIVLSLLCLLALYLIFRRYVPDLYLNLTLVTAFTIFIFKAGYFQTELLFYLLFFSGFLLMSEMLAAPNWKLGVMTGLVLGIGHLTKASVLPGLALFLAWAVIRMVSMLYERLKSRSPEAGGQNRPLASALLSTFLVALVFLAVIYPYISTSKRVFGRYLYNVNSTFYIWYDSWGEAKQGTRAHGDRVGWPDMPEEEIPSLEKYVREHTLSQIVSRPLDGFWTSLVGHCTHSYGYCKYVGIYSLAALVVVALNLQTIRGLAGQHRFVALFVLSFFVVYLLLYSWYAPVASGRRFMLALFCPYMLTVSALLSDPSLKPQPVRLAGVQVRLIDVLNLLVLAVLLVDLYFILTSKVVTIYGGG
jgi:hypothetical protein